MMNPEVDTFFTAGCGRCPKGGTPECKVHNWTEELKKLRMIVLDCGLTEELKWGVPCYTFQGGNVVVIGALNNSCTLGFFKGALLHDANGILTKPGENTQAARVFAFTHIRELIENETILKAYIYEAVEIEKAGLKMEFKKVEEYEVPAELQQKLAEAPAFKAAFEALTPGRQKGYILHFAQPKQAKTRVARIEKCMPKIFQGKGLNDW